jgi:uncharacterized membrane protein YeiH
MEQIWFEIQEWINLLANSLRIPSFFLIIEFVGTFAFALSGIRLASAKQFDVFGAWIVGMATAIGGGTFRDIMLGLNPFWMVNEIYFIWCALAVLFVHIIAKYLVKQKNTWFIFDTIGLAVFAITGIEKTLDNGFPYWTAILMGTLTGAGGGVLRDIFINVEPLIFRKEIYALACVIGGIFYWLCHEFLDFNHVWSGIVCAGAVIIMRLLAVRYKLHLPNLKGED